MALDVVKAWFGEVGFNNGEEFGHFIGNGFGDLRRMLNALFLRKAGVLIFDDDAGSIGDVERFLGTDDHAFADVVFDLR